MAHLQGDSETDWAVIQWANDWVSLERRDGEGGLKIANPKRLYLDPEESARFRADAEAHAADPRHQPSGQFWHLWKLSDDGERLVPAMKRPRH